MNSTDCNCACPTPVTTEVPGAQGLQGVNAFTTTTANFVVPAQLATVAISVDDGTWAVVGQNIFVEGAGYFEVTASSAASITATYLDYVFNTYTGATIVSGAKISPAGTQAAITDPLPVANGGTGATTDANARAALSAAKSGANSDITSLTALSTPLSVAQGGTGGATKAAAIASLGVGQILPAAAAQAGLTQTITNSATLISGATVTAPAAGSYLILARATVNYAGVTFAASRQLALRVQNTTQASTVVSTTKLTQILTTLNVVSQDYFTPFKIVTLAAGDVLELQISFDTVNSAGTAQVSEGNLIAVPIALT